MRNVDTGVEYTLLSGTVNDGDQLVTIPSTVPEGPYRIEIKGVYGGVTFMDVSDAYFMLERLKG